MRVAALFVGFEHRTDVHAHADRHLPRRHAIVAHGITHAVGEDAELPRGVARNVAAGVKPVGVLRPALRGRGRSTVLRACGPRRQARSEERRAGTACGTSAHTGLYPYAYKKKQTPR